MKKIYLIIIAVLCTVSVFAQKKIPFTQEMRDKLDGNELSLRQVQFYISKEIILSRKSNKKDIKLDAGKINFEDRGKDEAIVIAKETQGICEDFTKKSVKVRYEEGVNRGIQFIRNQNNLYQIAADDWSTGNGKMRYDTSFFYLDKDGANAILLVKKGDIRKQTKDRKKAKGLKVSTAK